MVLWKSKLDVSCLSLKILLTWQYFLYSFLLYHVALGNGTYINLLLGVLVTLECRSAAKALRAQVGDIQIDEKHNWIWHNKIWRLQGQPFLFGWGGQIILIHPQQRIRFWLMQDKMSESEWRQLRCYLNWHYPKHRQELDNANNQRNGK